MVSCQADTSPNGSLHCFDCVLYCSQPQLEEMVDMFEGVRQGWMTMMTMILRYAFSVGGLNW